jgi:nicotinic acid mononucleotide adenylyltransferase
MLTEMNKSSNIMETNTVVFCFGRCQPVTKGHEKMVSRVVAEAKVHQADHVVFLSQTQSLPDNPLSWNYKRNFARAAFPGVNISEDTSIKTPYQALEKLAESYKNIIFVCGDDRIEQFSSMADYAKSWGVASFITESAGARNHDLSDTKDLSNISASIARDAAKEGMFLAFFSFMPAHITRKQATSMYNKLRSEMGLEESPEELNKEADEYRQGSLRGEFFYTGSG